MTPGDYIFAAAMTVVIVWIVAELSPQEHLVDRARRCSCRTAVQRAGLGHTAAASLIDDDEAMLVRGSNDLDELCNVIADRWVGNARPRRAVYPTPCARP